MSKRAIRHLNKMVKELDRETLEAEREGDEEMREMYAADCKDYAKIQRLLVDGHKAEAIHKYDHLDTASREYIFDYLNDDDAAYMNRFFGWDEQGGAA